jgi:hypothetical protein
MTAEPATGKSPEMAAVLKRDVDKWRNTIEVAGIKRE